MAAKHRGIQLVYPARLGRLLPMEYTPGELAAELGCNAHQIRQTALPAGCPHRRDGRGRIWIVGTEFRKWYESTQVKRRHPMATDEAWCFACGKPVRMSEPFEVIPRHGAAELVKARCEECGAAVNRLRSRSREMDL